MTRFDRARDSPGLLFKFWTVQAVWVWVTLLPTLIANTQRRNPPLATRDYIGWTVWAGGFLIELVADMQKSIFKADPTNEVRSCIWPDHGTLLNSFYEMIKKIIHSGQIYPVWPVERVPSPKLFRGNLPLVRCLHFLQLGLPWLAVSQARVLHRHPLAICQCRAIASRDDGLLDFWATLTVGSKNCHNDYFGGRCVTVRQRVEPGAGDVADHPAVRGAAAGGGGGQAVGSPARVQAISSRHSGPHSLHQNLNSYCCDSKHND